MSQVSLTTNVRHITDKVSIIDVSGEITRFAEGVLTDAYSQASADGVRAILFNFSDLEYMNSSGIGLLVTLLIRAQRQQQALLAFGVSDHYKNIFRLTRLNEVIRIYDSEAEALAAVGAA